ncbi:hypothetical protein JQ629_12200 [Bradyrhizobium sp. AUGA SZCCT0222]|uniref:hypothetical protein n=1 Tax=Bradyrhizobium sp. AUGA SZCCT0222 TaxID=2807668 RepID=UPI001BA55422|nr:hypothetical protein [Bradyrhizobium sp. AUGA SZCCT0222]MBR1268272.1 hypothetical protein [Bradyrhizobium sp. AUGA SZCCT0222]
MVNSRNSDQSVRLLDDAALEAVAGGVKDGCIPGRPVPKPPYPTGDWTFKDVFARWTIG